MPTSLDYLRGEVRVKSTLKTSLDKRQMNIDRLLGSLEKHKSLKI